MCVCLCVRMYVYVLDSFKQSSYEGSYILLYSTFASIISIHSLEKDPLLLVGNKEK